MLCAKLHQVTPLLMDHLALVGLNWNCMEGETEFLLSATTFLSPDIGSQHGPCIREYPYLPRSEDTHLTTALTNCSARRETLCHCSLGRSTCWQHSSGTSREQAQEKPTNSSCSFFPKVKVYFFEEWQTMTSLQCAQHQKSPKSIRLRWLFQQ